MKFFYLAMYLNDVTVFDRSKKKEVKGTQLKWETEAAPMVHTAANIER